MTPFGRTVRDYREAIDYFRRYRNRLSGRRCLRRVGTCPRTRDGPCRDTASAATADINTFTDACRQTNSDTFSDAHLHCYADAITDPHAHWNSVTDANAYKHTHSYANSHTHVDAYPGPTPGFILCRCGFWPGAPAG